MLSQFRVYQLAVRFAQIAQTTTMPTGLRDQWLRAAQSVALNLAEGAGKFHSPKEQKRFYRIAFGSIKECQACLDIAENIDPNVIAMADSIAAQIYRLAF